MKFNNKKRLIKITYCSLLLLIIFTFCNATEDKFTSENMAPILIRNQLDSLINTLEVRSQAKNEEISKEIYKNNKEEIDKSQINEINKNKNLQDEVVNAIHDLNKDLIEYDDILNDQNTNKNPNANEKEKKEKNGLIENEDFFKELKQNDENKQISDKSGENINTNNDKISNSSKKYLNEVNDLTKNIDNSFEQFDLFDKIQKEKEALQKKINHVKEIIHNVTELKNQIQMIKNNKNLLEERRHKMKNISENLIWNYDKFLNMQKNTDVKIQQELQDIKKRLILSFSYKNNFNDIFKVFENLLNFHNKMHLGNFQDLNNKLHKFKDYITMLSKSDQANTDLM